MRAMMRAQRLFHYGRRPPAVCSRSRAASITSTSPSSSPLGAQSTAPQEHQQDKRPADVFQRAKRGSFFQPMPQLQNPFLEDPFLRAYLTRVMPAEVVEEVFSDLERFGSRLCSEIDTLGRQCELEPPYLRPYDAWGHRVDELVTCGAWRKMHHISAEEGLVAIGYERKHQQWSRLHQAAKLYLYTPSSGLYSCPLAMTDGAAKLIETSGDEYLRERAYPCLTTREPGQFWTSGQWMTERGGGSDVAGGTDTVATPQEDGSYRLHGYKWFSSATDASMAFTLARIQDQEGNVTKGTRGLSLFYLETRDEDGQHNNLEIQCLKNKLGTRQLPTGELLLDGTRAHLVGEVGRGVVGISPMLTITRLHNSISSVGGMRRILQLSRDYCTKREAFGRFLADFPLHMQTLARMEVETRGCVLLTLEVCQLLGREECGVATSSDKHLIRILTPILKLYTAKQAVSVASEGLESFGGQGYIEDTGLPTFLRDAQVLPIWEGTTNILSLDVLRVLQKSGGEALSSLVDAVKSRLSTSQDLQRLGLESEAETLRKQLDSVVSFGLRAAQEDPAMLEVAARDFAYSLAHIYIGTLLIEHASAQNALPSDRVVAQRWCSRPVSLLHPESYSTTESNKSTLLVMDGHGLAQRSRAQREIDSK